MRRWAPALALVILLVDALLPSPSEHLGAAALLDWTGHVATGLLAAVAIGLFWPPFLLGVVLGSVLIDADHIPPELGSDVLTQHTGRPFTHSLLTLAVVGAVALVRRSLLWAGVAFGLALHFVRDTAAHPGVPLLWPLSDHGFVMGLSTYHVVVLALAIVSVRWWAVSARSSTA